MKHIERREEFDRQVCQLLTRLGARPDPMQNVPWSCYRLDTVAGPLSLSVHTELYLADKSWAHGGGCPWVAGRFDDVKAAHALTLGESNPYSGKWNHHLWHNWPDSFRGGLELLEYQLRRVVAAPPPKAA
jgi:hypothetical protein